MPDYVTRDGQVIRDATDEAIAAVKTLERIADEQAAATKMFAAPVTGPSAIERHTSIREAQFAAEREGRNYVVPPAPQVVPIAPDLSTMTPAQRWGMWRNSGAG